MMRRPTRSSSGHPTSPEPEMAKDPVERSTRSRVASDDLVVLDLPRITRNVRHPSSSDAEVYKDTPERSTRSRKASGDLVVLDLPRITRTGKRGTSGKSPEVSKPSPRDGGSTSSENKQKHEKRDLSPEDPVQETQTKRRRRSGRLTETEADKETHDVTEKQDKNEDDKANQHVEKKGKSSREKVKHDVHAKENFERVKEDRKADCKNKNDKPLENLSKEQKKNEDGESFPKEPMVPTRRRTRSGRYAAEEDEDMQVIQASGDGKSDHRVTQEISLQDSKSSKDKQEPSKSSSRSIQEKGTVDTLRLRSPPRSPEKVKKAEAVRLDVHKQDFDHAELTVKTSGKQSTKGPLSPPLRMSPRRARQPSGQKVQDVDSASDIKDTKECKSGEELGPRDATEYREKDQQESKDNPTAKETTEESHEVMKKSNSTRRDLSLEFNETETSTMSPIKQTKARKDEDIYLDHESTNSKDSDTSAILPKSPTKVKKGRSPMKSPRGESAPVSPRKGLRSCKALEPVVQNDFYGLFAGGTEQIQDSKVDVIAMEMEEPALSTQPSETFEANIQEGLGVPDCPESQETDQTSSPEAEQKPTLNEMLAMDTQKEEDDVTEIPDDVAAKIREWKVQEEDSVGFQGEEWYMDEVEEGEPFYFESDHMALKGNKDYRMLLRTITTLEAQRKQAVKDLDKLVTAQREALRNPLKFVHKLQKKDNLHLPSAQRIVLLPEIPWGRYLGHADSKELIQGLSHQTRASIKQKIGDSSDDAPLGHSGAGPSTGQSEGQAVDDEKGKGVIRGRLWDDTKPDTFNRLWTVEEQKRLENLLLKFPSEDIEARRWEKIAKELGNRTRHQVASRVQKYFIKLGKAGLPVPGRLPNLSTYTNKRPQQRRYVNPYGRLTLAPSTFLQSIRAPVLMTDEDDAFEMDLDYEADSIMEEDDVPAELKDSEEFRELMRLKKLRNSTLKQQAEVSHIGFSCDGCGVSPIIGVRWHCVTCPAEVSTDICPNCIDEDFQSELHDSSHRLEPIHSSQSPGFVDSDYTSFTGTSGDYNYLDPNYSPAVLG